MNENTDRLVNALALVFSQIPAGETVRAVSGGNDASLETWAPGSNPHVACLNPDVMVETVQAVSPSMGICRRYRLVGRKLVLDHESQEPVVAETAEVRAG